MKHLCHLSVSWCVSLCWCLIAVVCMSLCLVSAYVYDPVSVCLHVCVFMYVSLCIYLYSFVSMCLHVSISLCLCVYVLVCVCVSQYMYVCLYVFQYLCFCVFVSRVCMGLYLYISVDPFFPEDNQNPGPIHSPPISILWGTQGSQCPGKQGPQGSLTHRATSSCPPAPTVVSTDAHKAQP